MASRTVGSKSCNSRSDMEFRGKNFFSRGLSFSRSFSRRLQSTSVIANIQHWTTGPSSWSMRSPPPVISSPVVNSCSTYSSPPGPTVSQMWYDLSVSSNSLKACNSPKVSVTAHLKPPPCPSPSGKQRYLFKRVGTTNTGSKTKNGNNNSESGSNSSNDDVHGETGSTTSLTATTTTTTTGDAADKSDVVDEKLESSDYLTVFVGERSCKRVKYVISKHFLRHHLFQVLLKCSEDEVGLDNEERGGVPIVCDPALFVQLVTVIGATLFAEVPADANSK